MYNINDNVVALATSLGSSAINVIRCSGPNVLQITQRIINNKKKIKPNFCFLAVVRDPQTNDIVDQCMVTSFLKPKSYTGQDLVEFSIHGGRAVYEKMIKLLNSEGCRIAERGEFTYRAFINGKIDLIQAEAVSNIVNSKSAVGVSFAQENLKGALSNVINAACDKLKNIITYMEHELDFNEKEIDYKTYEQYHADVGVLIKKIKKIMKHSFLDNENKCDIRVVIAGKTNAGKSSLFNYLAGYKRSIVTNISGTTRDTVEIDLTINDINVSLVDTAGLRQTNDIIEKKGIERTHQTINSSDLVIFVDEKDPIKTFHDIDLKVEKKKILFVRNKIDLSIPKKDPGVFYVSCREKIGGDKLLTCLSTLVNERRMSFMKEYSYIISLRAMRLLELFVEKLEVSQKLLTKKEELAVITSSLYNAFDLFVATTNPSNKEDLINNIFKGFCVGK